MAALEPQGRALVLAVLAGLFATSLQGCFEKASSLPSKDTMIAGPARGVCSALQGHGRKMTCGEGVEVCGVLTLETGEGSGPYRHPQPVVHGLWPETGSYGTSKCDAPEDDSAPRKVYPCYNTQGSASGALSFERHEWEKHGYCAGVDDADDFFTQVCALANGPLQVMAGARAAGMDLVDTTSQLQRAGYCVFEMGGQKQVQLSACKDKSHKWHLADVRSFPAVCGHGGSSGGGGTSGGKCIAGQRGPSCHRDTDCYGLSGCLRCANSGHCTNVPLRSLQLMGNTTVLAANLRSGLPTVETLPAMKVAALLAAAITAVTAAFFLQRWWRVEDPSSCAARARASSARPLIKSDAEEPAE